MPFSLPYTIYEKLEKHLGKESAHDIAESLENVINSSFEASQDKLKYEVIEELRKELASKYDVELLKKDIESLRKEMDMLRKEMDMLRKEMDLKLDSKIGELRKEMRIQFLILLFIIILLNQSSLEFLARLLGLMK